MADPTDIQVLIEKLHRLQHLRERLLTKPLSPEGAWIHYYEVSRKYPSGNVETYGYAKWQAHEPIFKRNPKQKIRSRNPDAEHGFTKHQHIGRVWSTTGLGTDPAVTAAQEEFRNRKRLEMIDQAIAEIGAILDRVEVDDSEDE